jgi:NAD(P)-dependent dehydrogenase (short-subunit alcohol dehydrogenase family)
MIISGPIDTSIFRDGEGKGLFNSEIISGATLLGRMGKADEVAKVLCFLLSDDASYVTGGKCYVLSLVFDKTKTMTTFLD